MIALLKIFVSEMSFMIGINKIMSKSKFLRVRHSENFAKLQPNKIANLINNHQYLYYDFTDESNNRNNVRSHSSIGKG